MRSGAGRRRGFGTAVPLSAAKPLALGALALASAAASAAHAVSAIEAASAISPSLYSALRWRLVGPFRGGRALAAQGIPDRPSVYYFGAVNGGVWKTVDAGETWQPLFQHAPVSSIGALAIAPSNPDILYIGTGEADMRSDITFGDGVWKSTDRGETWRHVGLDGTRHIGRIYVDPHDPDIVLVAAMGHAYGPNAQRGVFRTSDGGRTWRKVLYKDADTGAIDLAGDAGAPGVIYAALWQARRVPWGEYAPVEGPGSGLYQSTDSGLTWHEIVGHGLPTKGLGRIGIAIAPGTGGERVYAIVGAEHGAGLYRSDDGGKSWRLMNEDARLTAREWYFGTLTVDPSDPQTVYIPKVALLRATDGGKSVRVLKSEPGGDDYHFVWVNPRCPQDLIVASDQGTIVSLDRGRTWSSWYNQPTGQFYHVATDTRFPYRIYGAQQDSGTVSIASRSDYGEITFRDWYSVQGGESGYIAPDPEDPDVVYAGDYGGRVFRFHPRTGQARNVSPYPLNTFGEPFSSVIYRFDWTAPMILDARRRALYLGAQYVLKTTNGGVTWSRISPDLTGALAAAPRAGPLTLSNARERGQGVLYALALSPRAKNEIWAGSDSGLIFLTRDGGVHWRNVTPKDHLPAWSKVSLIDASSLDAGSAYAAIDRSALDDFTPYIYRTHDFGRTWQRITHGLAAPSFVRSVRADPVRRGLLYAGTETGVAVSLDDGDHWQSLQQNLPTVAVRDLAIHGNDLIAATHGRSFWLLDDLTPLRELRAEIAAEPAHLFRPAAALRLRANESERDTPLPPEVPHGENPPPGAIIDFYLRDRPSSPVTLAIFDCNGKLIRRFRSTATAPPVPIDTYIEAGWVRSKPPFPVHTGHNRFVWDLRYPSPAAIEQDYSMAAVYGEPTPLLSEGPLVLPGRYTIRLSVSGRAYSEPLTVRLDPRVRVEPAALAEQLRLAERITRALTQSQSVYSRAAHLAPLLRKRAVAQITRINSQLAELLTAVESADAAPTGQEYQTLESLQTGLSATSRSLAGLTLQPFSKGLGR